MKNVNKNNMNMESISCYREKRGRGVSIITAAITVTFIVFTISEPDISADFFSSINLFLMRNLTGYLSWPLMEF